MQGIEGEREKLRRPTEEDKMRPLSIILVCAIATLFVCVIGASLLELATTTLAVAP